MSVKTGFKKNPFRKYRPEVTLTFSFFAVILVGTLLLMLDVSNVKPGLSFIDALFTATTSTCVTGLTTVTVAEQFTIFGQVIILILIQIGGLGFMTFISVLLLFMRAKLEFKEKLLLKDALNKEDFHGVGGYIKAIIAFTFACEFIGFALIFSQLYTGENLGMELFQSLFLAISAFCNAGIDNLGATSLTVFQSNIIINLTISGLIIMGGLGFAVWFDISHNIKLMKKLHRKFKDLLTHLTIHSKIVLVMTVSLLLGGTVIILALEYGNTLSDMSFIDKTIAAFFNSVTLRTAGFYTIDYSAIRDATKIIMILFMFIGGSPGGTAGGIKTTTFFLLIYAIRTLINDSVYVRFFKREVPLGNVIKAIVVFLMYTFIMVSACFLITLLENQDFIDILFEVVSALATVGLTTGITSSLCAISKIIIIVLMFIGRVGPITIAVMLKRHANNAKGIRYPMTDVVVG